MPDVSGLKGMRQVLEISRGAIADMHGTIEDLVAEGDKVACRWSGRFTHRSNVMGVDATGKASTVTGIAIYRIVNGKIQEEWDYIETRSVSWSSWVSVLCRVGDRLSANWQGQS
jgi:predicted ester cyclase